MTKKKEFPIPFRCGDKVKYVGKDHTWKDLPLRRGYMIIHECIPSITGQHEYSTCHGAWFVHCDLELIEAASQQSIYTLCNRLESDLDTVIEEQINAQKRLKEESNI